MNKNKKKLIIFLIGFVIGVVGFTGSFLMYLKPSDVKKEEKIVADKPESEIVFSSIDNSIYLEDTIPTLDKFGVDGKGFSFTIKNTSNQEKQYELKLIDDESTIKNSDIRYQLIRNDKVIGIYSLSDDGILEKSTISSQEEVNYVIKIWLDYNSDVKSGKFRKKVAIEELLEIVTNEINKPVLTEGMIPVYYDNDTNSWYKANETNIDNKWYDYESRKWANVVTVNSEVRDSYLNSEIGTRIVLEDINSMWVWIPRFNYSEDNISFVNKVEKSYVAFTFNNQELDGFWFSKFESGMKEDSDCINLSLTAKCNNTNNLLYFVPNYPYTTKMTMANMFYTIRKMELKNNIYGFNGTGTKLNNDGTIKNDNNEIDIHMIKNTEWQAVVLLTSSKYGKNGNTITNNNSSFTGKVREEEEDYGYNVIGKGNLSSTTGNVTGIYDMAGGKREYVMVDTNELNIFNKKSNSGFTTKVKEYYYDNGFTDEDKTLLLSEKYSKDNLINEEPITRGGYKNVGNIFTLYGATDYIDKVSIETNTRASLVIIKGE